MNLFTILVGGVALGMAVTSIAEALNKADFGQVIAFGLAGITTSMIAASIAVLSRN